MIPTPLTMAGRLVSLGGMLLLAASPPARAELRLAMPPTVDPDGGCLVWIEHRQDEGPWRLANPDDLTVDVTGAGRLGEDPSGLLTNPVTVLATAADGGIDMTVGLGGESVSRRLPIGAPPPEGRFRLSLPAGLAPGHAFEGFGGGVLFYDNQWEITDSDDLYEWCFRDVETRFLHLLVRPDYEPANDNDDWRTLAADRFDFTASQRALGVARRAIATRPELEVYVSLYSPPAWMKANDSTAGTAGLKAGGVFRRELAEYLAAFLLHAKREHGIDVAYLAFFNEPDWPHSQDGMHIKDLGELADIFADAAEALETILAGHDDLAMPRLVFPDSLGPGSITRAGRGTQALLDRRAMLRERVAVWGVHDYWNTGGYWDTRYRELREFPPVAGKPIWMTEWAQRSRRGDLASGVEYAEKILNSIRLGSQAWMVFEWIHPSENQSGLLSTDWSARPPRRRYWRSKAYHVFRQLANNTPVGSRVVATLGRLEGLSGRSLTAGGPLVEHLAVLTDDELILHLASGHHAPIELALELEGVNLDRPEVFATGPTGDVRQLEAVPRDLPPHTLLTIRASLK